MHLVTEIHSNNIKESCAIKDFVYFYPTKVYFGEKAAQKSLPAELQKVGKTVMVAYGSGSVKKNGVYDEMVNPTDNAINKVVDFINISESSFNALFMQRNI